MSATFADGTEKHRGMREKEHDKAFLLTQLLTRSVQAAHNLLPQLHVIQGVWVTSQGLPLGGLQQQPILFASYAQHQLLHGRRMS